MGPKNLPFYTWGQGQIPGSKRLIAYGVKTPSQDQESRFIGPQGICQDRQLGRGTDAAIMDEVRDQRSV